jgi:hypothetical protein
VSRGEERKREREEKKKKKGWEPYSIGEWRHGGWRDSFVSRAVRHGVTQSMSDETGLSVASQQSARLSRTSLFDTT